MAQRSNSVLIFVAVVVGAIVIAYALVSRKPASKPGPETAGAPAQQEPAPAEPEAEQGGVTHIDQTTDTTYPGGREAGPAAQEAAAAAEGTLGGGADSWEHLHPLHAAASRGDAAAITTLIEAGADPNERLTGSVDADMTALMLAAQNGHVDAVFALLNGGADLTLRDKTRRAARDYALARYDQAGQTIARILGEAAGPGPVQDPGEK